MNELIKKLILTFSKLQRIGEKSAERIVFLLPDKFGEKLYYLEDKIKYVIYTNSLNNEAL